MDNLYIPCMVWGILCEEIRKKSVVPILFLTAKLSEEDKITGFSAGADDYLVKPFSAAELLARINALLRRHQVYDTEFNRDSQKEEWIERHGIVISSLYNDVYMGEKELCLTDIECCYCWWKSRKNIFYTKFIWKCMAGTILQGIS